MAYTEDCPSRRTQGSVSSHTVHKRVLPQSVGRFACRSKGDASPVCPESSGCPHSRCRRPRPPRRRRGTRASCALEAATRCRCMRCRGAISVRISAWLVFRTYLSVYAVFRPVVEKRSAVAAELLAPGQVDDCLDVVHLRCCRTSCKSQISRRSSGGPVD